VRVPGTFPRLLRHYWNMDCDSIRAAISASLDGEDAGIPADVTRAHLDSCAACRAWRERQHALTRHARLTGYALEHDLTARILTALEKQVDPGVGDPATAGPVLAESAAVRSRSEIPLTRRLALALVAIAQLAITVPLLILGHDRDAGVHAAHELGSFDLALAIAFVVGVVRPKLSAGLAWPCCVAALGLAGTAIIDMMAGQTFGADEAQHMVAVVGALLLFWQSRTVSSRTIPADPVSTAPSATGPGDTGVEEAADWSEDRTPDRKLGRPVARKEGVA
jgi:predicted anti-sigma-YlaC factor YlaD